MGTGMVWAPGRGTITGKVMATMGMVWEPESTTDMEKVTGKATAGAGKNAAVTLTVYLS